MINRDEDEERDVRGGCGGHSKILPLTGSNVTPSIMTNSGNAGNDVGQNRIEGTRT